MDIPQTRYARSGDVNIAYQGMDGRRPLQVATRIGAGGAGDVLVSATVRDLVAGSGIEFEDRGLHALKGLPEKRQLYAVLSA